MPTLAPRESGPVLGGKVEAMTEELARGSVMLTGVEEKRETLRKSLLPLGGCC